MPVVGDLPLAIAATCSASVRVQQMAVEAAVHADVTLLKQAMLHDALVAAVCNPEEIWQMTDEMLVAQAPWLPQYAAQIPAAAARLAQADAEGTRVPLRDWQGAARLHTKTVEEMAADRAAAMANAAAADKGQMTKEGAH
jgi:alpha-galactosidase